MARNERKTENIVRKALEILGYADADFLVEEQKSENPIITKLLKNSSKSGNGMGKPEFIITKRGNRDFLIVIECKADPRYHESTDRNLYKDYAVDGTLLYAGYLSKEYNVIAVAASGETESELKISTFLHPKNCASSVPLLDENGHMFQTLADWGRYVNRATFDPVLARSRHADLMKFSKELHDYLRDYAKVTEAQKPLLVSGVLLALMDPGFERAYSAYE